MNGAKDGRGGVVILAHAGPPSSPSVGGMRSASSAHVSGRAISSPFDVRGSASFGAATRPTGRFSAAATCSGVPTSSWNNCQGKGKSAMISRFLFFRLFFFFFAFSRSCSNSAYY